MTFNSPDSLRNDLYNFPESYKKIKFNKSQLNKLEESPLLNLSEKLCILQLLTNTRVAVETGFELFQCTKQENLKYKELPSEVVKKYESFLNELPFPYIKVERMREFAPQTFKKLTLFVICSNQITREYIANYYQTFKDFEYGVLFGYPVSTILAYIKLIERFEKPNWSHIKEYTAAMKFIGPGFYSRDHFEDEKLYYEKIWKMLQKISVKLTNQAEAL
ncbi:MAG: hypothetical protein E6Q58_05375 [Niabella sp.]|nr:MAG: hypothetical protein E6Q58_05375 [Niabella sp.]